ncbi:MAG: nuclear transport factor 2 family protein [Candidatus Devosia phytovorans]|uniref:Nuclear transport factor 2 family protein n=1 Tax=Candidatus Devosia phytovorans TaxID=3121372 RepID=A0AAJ5VUJ6_9HYPH|nr:nuclear transport factor 2 family protein [Devosia sp.]WEK04587.1 MAG: nuclear transport factor 2 family protein [Devosia sp.]
MSEIEDNKALVKRLYEGFAAGDLGAVLGTMSPGVQWTEAEGYPYAGTYEGHDAVVAGVFGRLATEWDGYTAVPENLVAEGNTVVAIGVYQGRYKATGRSFKAPFVHVWTVEDGKLARFVQHTDTVLVQAALGE